jgi:hypothetical protein
MQFIAIQGLDVCSNSICLISVETSVYGFVRFTPSEFGFVIKKGGRMGYLPSIPSIPPIKPRINATIPIAIAA